MTSEPMRSEALPPEPTFRVCEAPPRDVGRGLVRLDPEDLAHLGVQVGDLVAITGNRTTAARAMPAHAAQRGQKLIQMDGLLRNQCGHRS